MYMLGPDILKLSPSAYTVAQELERYKMGVLKVRIDQTWHMMQRVFFVLLFAHSRVSPLSSERGGVGWQNVSENHALRS